MKSLVSIVLVALIVISVFVGTASAVRTGVGTLKVKGDLWHPYHKYILVGHSAYQVVTVYTNMWNPQVHGVIKGVTVEKLSGPAWLKIEGETNLGTITHPESKKFTIRASPTKDTEDGRYAYKIRVSCTSGNPSYIDIQGGIKVYTARGKGTLKVKVGEFEFGGPWNPSIRAGYPAHKIVTVSTNSWMHSSTMEKPVIHTIHGVIKGITVEKISGPAWLKIEGETDLGDITHPESKKFTIRASPPEDTEGKFPYKIRVSCTSGDPSYIDIQGEITVSPPTPTKPTQIPERPSWPTSAPAPVGFEAIFAIAGSLTAVTYLIRRRRVK